MNNKLLKYRWGLVAAVLLLAVILLAVWQGRKIYLSRSPQQRSGNSVDITVTQEGIYQVSAASLGWEPADLENVQLLHRDLPLPVWMTPEGQDAKIHFFGESSDSIYSNQNVYQLTLSTEPGSRISEITAAPIDEALPIEQINSQIRIEENLIYSPLPESGDHWFWTKLVAPTSHTAEFTLEATSSGEGSVKVALWGNTEAPSTPDHHVIVSINGIPVAEKAWDGQTRAIVEGEIPSDVLQEGPNTIEIESPGDTGILVDIVSVDWIEITYPRRSQLTKNQTAFTTRTAPIQFTEMEDAVFLFDVTQAVSVSVRKMDLDSPTFLGEQGKRYIAVQPGGWLQPEKVEPTTLDPDIKDRDGGADYLIIGPEDLLAPFSPLIELRAEQDLSVKKIPVSAVYDQFNGGIEEPQAIQAFLAYATDQWQMPPKYVLLAGDASYDFRDYTNGKFINRLPVMMIQTIFGGQTGSDVLLADINEDPWPDLAIGRLPAQTPEQIETYVEKVLRYENENSNPDSALKILAVADGQEKIFENDAANFLENFPEDFDTTLLAPAVGNIEADQEVIAELNQGYWLTGYFGHGSIHMWGKDQLFTIDDVDQLKETDRPPIMLNFTCLTGLFTHPSQESLTERLIWYPKGGAIAVLAPTSLTLSWDQQALSNAFVQALSQDSNPRLGDALLAAWRSMPTDSTNSLDVLRTFLLFGDPALILP